MKFAIVGCGFIAERYATDLRHYAGLSLVAATDLDEDRSRAFVDRHGGTAYPDLATLLHDSDAELVINLTVHAAHAEVTRTCLGAGRHVFSEKPLALDADEADELVALADRKGLTLGCAPGNLLGDAQQLVGHYLQSGRLGTVRMVYAECNLGRVTQWSNNPEAFLRAGPLFDGAVYPLTLLVGYFGPVIAVEAAHSALLLSEHDHPATGTRFSVDTPDQVTALLRHENGTLVRLSASMYVPAQTKHFYSIEFHGDAGSLYLANSGDTGPFGPHAVEFARVGKGYLSVPLPKPSEPRGYGAAIRETVAAIGAGRPTGVDGARAAHLVTIIDRVNRCATSHRPQTIDPLDLAKPTFAFPRVPTRLPPIGFGCSRFRGDHYVDLNAAMEDALDVGYRLFDLAELYGTEAQFGDLLRKPGSPERDTLYLVGKVWNTNHGFEQTIAACEQSLQRLGTDAFDLYLIHWPQALRHTGPLGDLSLLSADEAAARAFPQNDHCDPDIVDIPLTETWRALETLLARGRVKAIGVSNFGVDDLKTILDEGTTPPAVNQIEHHPYRQQRDLVDFCHDHNVRVMAYSPLAAPGLLDDPTIVDVAEKHGCTPAQVVLAWNLAKGIVPIPSSTSRAHLTANLDVFAVELDADEVEGVGGLEPPA